MKYKCDIVTVTYNSSETILNFLKSLESNKDYIHSVILLENHSPDRNKTKSIVKQYVAEKNKKLPYKIHFKIQSENFGFAHSCNEGAELCTAPYILFLNPDAQLEINSLKILIDHLIKHKSDIAGGLVHFGNKLQYTAVKKPGLIVGLFEFTNLGKILGLNIGKHSFYPQSKKFLTQKEKDELVDAVSGAYLLIKTKSFKKLHGFDDNFFMYLEDVDLGVRAVNEGMKVLFCPHSKITHIGGFSSKNKHKIHHQAWFWSRKYFYLKHYGLVVNVILQPIFFIEEKILFLRLKAYSLLKK